MPVMVQIIPIALFALFATVNAAFDPTPYELNIAFVEYSSDDYFLLTPSTKPVLERQFLQFFVDKWNTDKTFFPNNNVTIKLTFTPACLSRNIGTFHCKFNRRPG
jgi:hypothetical protein